MSFEWTEPRFVLLVVLALPAWLLVRHAPGRVLYSSLRVLPARAATWRTRLAWVPDVMFALAIVALAFAMAGPHRGAQDMRVRSEGIAIAMVVDTSSSMAALDLSDDTERTRLDAVKQVFEAFALERQDDAIGLVSFARYADTRSPLTLDHGNLIIAARQLQLTPGRTKEDGTAIGDGLALAVERLASSKAKSKVAIVLTDGEDNASQVTPEEAAALARSEGIKVYTIGAGTNGVAPLRVTDPSTGQSQLMQVPVSIDEDLLRGMAEATGGAYFRATDAATLRKVYEQIDELETVELTETRFYQYDEYFDRLVAIGLALAVLAFLLRATAFPEGALMLGWEFYYEERAWLVWVVIAIVGGLAALELRGRGSLAAMLSPVMQHRLVVRPSVTRMLARLGLVLLGLLAGVGAMMRPQALGETSSVSSTRASADVIVVLDVSKSMLAEDAAPNRLERAKAEIARMARELRGHRLGLIAFAGRAVLLCPLTPDEAFFDLVLRGVDVRSVSRGGTRIGDAVRLATKSFPAGLGPKLIVLITDGEDQESAPQDAAAEARDAGVRIVAVGLGSTAPEGSEIIITDPKTHAKTPMMHDGVIVKSRLDGVTLEQMATTTEGVYVPAGTSALDLEAIVHEHVQPIVREETAKAERVIPAERYPWLVLASILCLLGAAGIGATAGRRL